MKTILFSISLAITSFLLQAQTVNETITNGTTITVNIPTQSEDGTIKVGLYTEDIFMKAAPAKSLSLVIKDGKAMGVFENIAPGTYAISLYQDKNSNNTMDFEPNGMPMEPYGTSNNVMSFGPPQWSEAKFTVESKPIEMEIRM